MSYRQDTSKLFPYSFSPGLNVSSDKTESNIRNQKVDNVVTRSKTKRYASIQARRAIINQENTYRHSYNQVPLPVSPETVLNRRDDSVTSNTGTHLQRELIPTIDMANNQRHNNDEMPFNPVEELKNNDSVFEQKPAIQRSDIRSKIKRLQDWNNSRFAIVDGKITKLDNRLTRLQNVQNADRKRTDALENKIDSNHQMLSEQTKADKIATHEKIKSIEETIQRRCDTLERDIDLTSRYMSAETTDIRTVMKEALSVLEQHSEKIENFEKNNYMNGQPVVHYLKKESLKLTDETLAKNGIEFGYSERYHPTRHVRLFEEYTSDHTITEKHKCSLFRGTISYTPLRDWRSWAVSILNFQELKDSFLANAWTKEIQKEAHEHFTKEFRLDGNIRQIVMAYEKWLETLSRVGRLSEEQLVEDMYGKLPSTLKLKFSDVDLDTKVTFWSKMKSLEKIREISSTELAPITLRYEKKAYYNNQGPKNPERQTNHRDNNNQMKNHRDTKLESNKQPNLAQEHIDTNKSVQFKQKAPLQSIEIHENLEQDEEVSHASEN